MSAPAVSLEEHMRALAAGHRAAFEPVFRGLSPPMLRFTRSLLRSEADAADATQEAMRKLFERATDYEYPRPVLPWALSIAAWECRTIARRRQRRRESSDVIEATSPLPSPDATFVEQELIRAAQAALSHLSERDAQTLETAFYAEDREAQSPAFRKRKQRAIEKLRQVMRKLYGIG